MLAQLLEELGALLAAAEEAGEDLTDEQAERAAELNTQIEAIKAKNEIRERSESFLKPSAKNVSFHTGTKKEDSEDRAFEHYLRTGQINSDLSRNRAQGEGVGSEGGFLVPASFRQKIVERTLAFGGLAPHAENITTENGSNLEWPTLDDTSSEGEIIAEGAQFTGGEDLVFGTASLGAYKYTSSGASSAPLRVSVELLQDSAFDVVGLITRALGTRIARAQAAHWITGTGVGEPQGIFQPSASQSVDVADVLDYEDLIDLEAALDPSYEQNAAWVMSKGTWTVVRKLVSSGDDRPLLFPNMDASIGGSPAKQLLGYPVIIDQQATTFGAATGPSTNLALGDWRESYVIRRVAPLTIVVNPYSRANFGQVEYVAWERADALVQNRNSYVSLANL